MVTVTRELWIEELRKNNGTKFRHQGRRGGPGGGLDCVGLLIVAASNLGIAHGSDKIKGYPDEPNEQHFDKWAGRFLDRLPCNRLQPIKSQLEPGDIITFWVDVEGIPRHVAVYTGLNDLGQEMMIHSMSNERRGVHETVINPNYWTRRVSRFYRLKEFRKG